MTPKIVPVSDDPRPPPPPPPPQISTRLICQYHFSEPPQNIETQNFDLQKIGQAYVYAYMKNIRVPPGVKGYGRAIGPSKIIKVENLYQELEYKS